MAHDWTQEEIGRVAGWLREGDSASEIRDKLPFDVSRNAVIGKVHRHKELSQIGFMTPARGGVNNKKTTQPRTPAAPKVIMHRPENRFAANIKGGVITLKPRPRSINLPACDEVQPVNIPLVEIRECQCKWPMWDHQGGPDFLMCGAATPIDRVYCAGHRARAATARAA
jgi:hypothetical protein